MKGPAEKSRDSLALLTGAPCLPPAAAARPDTKRPPPLQRHPRTRFYAAVTLLCGLLLYTGIRAQAPDSTATRVRSLIEETIGLGVPLYNSGQAAACAAVYRIALRSLLLLAPADIDQEAVRRALRQASGQDPERGAWTLRYALDDILLDAEKSLPVTDPMTDPMTNKDLQLDLAADANAWYSVNDNVMGGVSAGGLAATDAGTWQFSGRLSLQNNGGFSSVRTDVATGALAGYDGLEMRLRGDGRTYALLAAPAAARGSWQGSFVAPPQWDTVRVSFERMALSIRGWRPDAYPPIRGEAIGMIGLLIADKDERPFRLEVDWIRGYIEEGDAE